MSDGEFDVAEEPTRSTGTQTGSESLFQRFGYMIDLPPGPPTTEDISSPAETAQSRVDNGNTMSE